MIKYKFIDHREEWDANLMALPAAHVLQSWDWGAFKGRWGWQVERLLWFAEREVVAAAQILRRSIPGTPWNFLYVSKGPALDYSQPQLVEYVLCDLEAYAHQSGALFIKIDPDVPRYWGDPQEKLSLAPAGRRLLIRLEQRGWQFSSEQIQFRNTMLIDLEPNADDLLAAMKSKWRYNVRLAGRRGVTIQTGTQESLEDFYRIYQETAQRDSFLIRPMAYYQDVWSRFLETEQAELLLAEVEGEIIAGLFLFIFGSKAWYLYGASTDRHRRTMPNHLLQWTAIKRAKARGCRWYDMWGAPDTFDESDDMWGVYRFKQGFGGETVQGLGAFDYPAKPALYWVFTETLPKVRNLWRKVKSGR